MSRIAYVNGRYLRHATAGVSINERAFLFGDGVYEGIEVHDGRLVDLPRHLARLERSLAAIRIAPPMSPAALKFVLHEVVVRNRARFAMLYLQVTRGAAPRDHAFPAGARPGIVVTINPIDDAKRQARFRDGVAVVTRPDERWAHPHIKSLQLLPNVLAKQAAREEGAYECWLVDRNGFVTEGASTNAWIVTADGVLVTRQADQGILRGVTRATLLDAVAAKGLKFEERAFSLAEAYHAREAFFSSATTIATPVVKIDACKIGDGRPGPVATMLAADFYDYAS